MIKVGDKVKISNKDLLMYIPNFAKGIYKVKQIENKTALIENEKLELKVHIADIEIVESKESNTITISKDEFTDLIVKVVDPDFIKNYTSKCEINLDIFDIAMIGLSGALVGAILTTELFKEDESKKTDNANSLKDEIEDYKRWCNLHHWKPSNPVALELYCQEMKK